MCKKLICTILCFVMVLGMVLPAGGTQTESPEPIAQRTLAISSVEEFLEFAENCRLDSYSQGLSVTLKADIDLSGTEFEPIPIFCGSFDGGSHVISGLSLSAEGSAQGLFRYLTATAEVQDLTVSGSIHPSGSRNEVGAIAGSNEGKILRCSFTGSLSGSSHVGGLVGSNAVTGIIEECSVEAQIHGDHFTGGIAGSNYGVIRGCVSRATLNSTPQQNSTDLSDITLEALTNTETANTVTDIGGIAGLSTGIIRECENRGNVGYPLMGYNIGGIVGTQSGYTAQCVNYGSVRGRKEVGGIVGQLEPTSTIEYSEDTLQILRDQLDTMSGTVRRASANTQESAGRIYEQINTLQYHAQTASDSLEVMMDMLSDPENADPDAFFAAQNSLTHALNSMPTTLRGLSSATSSTVSTVSQELRAVSTHISAMQQTVNNAQDNLGGTVLDVSDQDTDGDLTAKVESCQNFGTVLADLNAGGIAGAISMESDLDFLEDLQQQGETSLNFQNEVRAVIVSCTNQASVTGSKQNVGGITGWQSMGLVKNSSNTGSLEAENARYVGGISGLSTGYLRDNYAKCLIRGSSYVGGIAGSGTVVTHCISMVQILGGTEKLGAILGMAEQSETQDEELPIEGNLYPVFDRDMGAIDGISYDQLAQSMEAEAFLEMESLPEMFRTVTARFVFEDGTQTEVTLRPGDSLTANLIPPLPEKAGHFSRWDSLEQTDLQKITCDITFEALYTSQATVIQSSAVRENGLPLLLAEGIFPAVAAIRAEEGEETPPLAPGEGLLEVWQLELPQGTQGIRLQVDPDWEEGEIKVLLQEDDSTWSECEFTRDGRYLVLGAREGTLVLALTRSPGTSLWVLAPIGLGVVILAGLWHALGKKKSRKEPLPQ